MKPRKKISKSKPKIFRINSTNFLSNLAPPKFLQKRIKARKILSGRRLVWIHVMISRPSKIRMKPVLRRRVRRECKSKV